MASYLYYLLPAVGGYALTSLYFLKNPHILHKKKQTAFYCTHISHRGGCGERIENTMGAFTHAVEVGTEMLEIDCHLTKDGHVVVSHDENLLRQTGQDVNISSLNLEELPPYKEILEVTFKTGHFSTGSDRNIALLEDVFHKFPHIAVNIEVKENNSMLIEKISDLVKKYNRGAISVWASVDSTIMENCRKTFCLLCCQWQNSSMPYMFTVKQALKLLLLYYTGLLPFVPLGESFLQFYLPQIINREYIPEMWILRRRLVIFLIERLTLRKGMFKHLRDRGIQIHLFVCNEEQDIEAAFAAGATGVMTDYPTLLSNYIRRHTQDT
ncbi:lysophospholipase D GDPD3a isoform X1 [Sinocyclocheilus grahami]|uniref:lysophospholipase D GDPD3a isoform X1 n=1 Tax=Sinocyclocheilus grahami TaxID=75366 RepID=UPI0007AD5C83|nr:PREDICTED: glycerophosphodiester phosphodiesterase domain-containing protein 1-like isoform X1 [Sinocyclocheilus grahami]XP_016134872.1 PREDICTED: glycerophosphodiester phosphodiesterase domain-containing protein 1-like isoform X1 [Sinocyclocheilus grahami]